MLYPRLKIELFKSINEVTSSTGSDITDSISGDISAGIETTKDIYTLKFKNVKLNGSFISYLTKKGDVSNRFRINDDLKIHSWYGKQPSNLDSSLLLFGTLETYDYNSDADSFDIGLRGANRTEELLNTMTPFSAYKGVGSTNQVHTIIKSMIKRLRQNNPKKQLYADLNNDTSSESLTYKYTGSLGGIQAFKSGAYDSTGSLIAGSSNFQFPEINYSESWKPIYLNIEKLSTPEFTKDDTVGTYIYYVRSLPVLLDYRNEIGSILNDLVWKSVPLLTSGSFLESDATSVTVGFGKDEIINVLIVDAGTDLEDAGIIGVAYDLDSIGLYGPKTDYYSDSRQTFSRLLADETSNGDLLGSVFDENGYPDDYPWEFLFTTRTDFGIQTTTKESAANDKEFNEALREESRWVAVGQANEVVSTLGNPRFEVNYTLGVGSNTFVPGDLKDIVIPSIGWEGTEANPSKKLRIRDWTHTFNNSGWNTKIVLKEDEKVISNLLNE